MEKVDGKNLEKVDENNLEKFDENLEKVDENLEKSEEHEKNLEKVDEKHALKDLGAFFPRWRANRAFKKVDVNHDGQISDEEIDSLLEYLHSRGVVVPIMWATTFSNGGVDEKDVIIMTQMRQINDLEKSLKVADKRGCNYWRVKRVFHKVDVNNDDQISGEEIEPLLEYLCYRGFGK
ncbi:EF-Hand 1 [Vigna unguiculata]|uniref:EF-Hand 1 n=1 Tax=Vigna unguiculata TaxID=3917 RepID=A0A4D6MG03_VIGUN|nr:EF-Hand 1 [Vigna unguiculata]